MTNSIILEHQMLAYLAREFRNVSSRMTEAAEDLEVAVYWYSGAFGAVQRVINFHPESELFLLHLVLQSTHGQLTSRLRRQLAEEERPVSLTEDQMLTLANLLDELADEIEELEDFSNTLESIARVGYASTGNGFYLATSGRFDV